jgi:hypothetical protein
MKAKLRATLAATAFAIAFSGATVFAANYQNKLPAYDVIRHRITGEEVLHPFGFSHQDLEAMLDGLRVFLPAIPTDDVRTRIDARSALGFPEGRAIITMIVSPVCPDGTLHREDGTFRIGIIPEYYEYADRILEFAGIPREMAIVEALEPALSGSALPSRQEFLEEMGLEEKTAEEWERFLYLQRYYDYAIAEIHRRAEIHRQRYANEVQNYEENYYEIDPLFDQIGDAVFQMGSSIILLSGFDGRFLAISTMGHPRSNHSHDFMVSLHGEASVGDRVYISGTPFRIGTVTRDWWSFSTFADAAIINMGPLNNIVSPNIPNMPGVRINRFFGEGVDFSWGGTSFVLVNRNGGAVSGHRVYLDIVEYRMRYRVLSSPIYGIEYRLYDVIRTRLRDSRNALYLGDSGGALIFFNPNGDVLALGTLSGGQTDANTGLRNFYFTRAANYR